MWDKKETLTQKKLLSADYADFRRLNKGLAVLHFSLKS
jgi:hypothetical protein